MANNNSPSPEADGRRNAVVLNCDEALFPVAAFLGQRLAALNPRSDTDIIVVSDSQACIDTAAALAPGYRPLWLDTAAYTRRLPPGYMHPLFHRYFLPDLLAPDYRRMLYVDVDIYPQDDRLFRIFDLDLAGNAVAGVRDLIIALPGKAKSTERDATIRNREGKYLNTGVMLIDIDAFNRQKLLDRMSDLMGRQKRPFPYPDQSALNILLDGRWLELSPAFNMLRAEYGSFVREVFPPVIVHFAGASKPWHGPNFSVDHPARAELEKFIAGSPWPRFLGRFFNFDKAWSALSQPAPSPQKGQVDFIAEGIIDRRSLLRHLRNTRFADVEAGIVAVRLDLLPA